MTLKLFCAVLVNLSIQADFWVLLFLRELLSLHGIMEERRDAQDSSSLAFQVRTCVHVYLFTNLLFEV